MRSIIQAIALAMRDYRHEALLSTCSVLGLAAALAPLLVLIGVRHGIISTMTERLLSDPRTLEITPVGSGSYGPDWFRDLSAMPETAFVMAQTRSIAATMNLRDPERPERQIVTPLTASGSGDPLLKRWSLAETGWQEQHTPRQNEPALPESGSAGPAPDARPVSGGMPGMPATGETYGHGGETGGARGGENTQNNAGANDSTRPTAMIVLSESAARKVGAAPQSRLEGRLDRVREGKRESASLSLLVAAVLPPEAHGTDMAYVPLELLAASEDYRDGLAVPFLAWSGDSQTAPANTLADYAAWIRENRVYASFRLYASSLDGVSPLWRYFKDRHIEVYVKADEIESVRSLDMAFAVIFGLITLATVFGLCASTASSAMAGVKRKSRSLGIMRLIGFSRSDILLFPICQTVTTGFFGFLLALALYLVVAVSIDQVFADSLPGSVSICTMPFSYGLAVCLVVILLSVASSFAAAWKATTIEPSEVIRDV